VASAKGQTILLSPFSISNNSSEPLEIPRRPPDLDWLDPELDHLPDFDWGWDQGAGKSAREFDYVATVIERIPKSTTNAESAFARDPRWWPDRGGGNG
jgi:hypothetical protein